MRLHVRRSQLEHLIRAASAIIESDDLIVIGSQAILGSYSDTVLPPSLTLSIEADFVPCDDADGARADLIDGSIGEASMFHDTYGVYTQGAGVGTALLRRVGWIGLCPWWIDGRPRPRAGVWMCMTCAVQSCLQARAKDLDFVRDLVVSRLADPIEIDRLLDLTEIETIRRDQAKSRLESWAPAGEINGGHQADQGRSGAATHPLAINRSRSRRG